MKNTEIRLFVLLSMGPATVQLIVALSFQRAPLQLIRQDHIASPFFTSDLASFQRMMPLSFKKRTQVKQQKLVNTAVCSSSLLLLPKFLVPYFHDAELHAVFVMLLVG
jgi:hypothetical protein